jgi:hypothetical protein
MIRRLVVALGLALASLLAVLPASAQEKPLVIMTSYAS